MYSCWFHVRSVPLSSHFDQDFFFVTLTLLCGPLSSGQAMATIKVLKKAGLAPILNDHKQESAQKHALIKGIMEDDDEYKNYEMDGRRWYNTVGEHIKDLNDKHATGMFKTTPDEMSAVIERKGKEIAGILQSLSSQQRLFCEQKIQAMLRSALSSATENQISHNWKGQTKFDFEAGGTSYTVDLVIYATEDENETLHCAYLMAAFYFELESGWSLNKAAWGEQAEDYFGHFLRYKAIGNFCL